jgi:hypothetical protein
MKRKGRRRDRVVHKRKEKSDGEKEDKWDTCPIVSGWEEIIYLLLANHVLARGKGNLLLF